MVLIDDFLLHLVEENGSGSSDIENKAVSGQMGVGKDMIGDVAFKAQSKDSDKVLETVQTLGGTPIE